MPPRKISGRTGRSRYFEKKISDAAEIAETGDEASDEAVESSPDDGESDEFEPDEKVVEGTEDEGELSEQEVEVEEEEEEEEEEEKPRRKGRGLKTAAPKKIAKSVAGVKRRLKPGEVFIPKKQLKRVGVDYEEGTIHPYTMQFLKELKENNEREWFHTNDSLYRDAKKNFDSFVEKLSEKIITDVDTTIPELPLKDLVFRVHRDIRFSNDQTPYKPYFSVACSRTGRKGPYGHYYLHIQPGNNFLGGGIWHPEASALAAMRKAIDKHPDRLMNVIQSDSLCDFMGVKKKGESRKKFLAMNAEDALKTAPKGFAKDHRNIELLRLRSFAVKRALTDEEVQGEDAVDVIADHMKKIEPLITYLNSVVRPDTIVDSDSEEEESGSE